MVSNGVLRVQATCACFKRVSCDVTGCGVKRPGYFSSQCSQQFLHRPNSRDIHVHSLYVNVTRSPYCYSFVVTLCPLAETNLN